MPILTIFSGLTTAPFASDDLHIICLILGVYRAILLLCLIPMLIEFYIRPLYVYHRWHTGIWCTNSQTLIFAGKFGLIPVYLPRPSHRRFLGTIEKICIRTNIAGILPKIDVAWLIILWACASMGTPTRPTSRDAYVRNIRSNSNSFLPMSFLVALLDTSR